MSKQQTLCKQAAEKLLGITFKENERPKFMTNFETNTPLELDLYNEQYKLAIEYNGIQHYDFPNFFNKDNKELFLQQIRRDDLKKKLCKYHGIILIIVSYKIQNYELYLTKKFKKYGLLK